VSWDMLTWRPADASTPEGVAPILNEQDLLRSALEEAVSSMLMAPVTIAAIEIADVANRAALPGEFTTVGTFELLGKERSAIAVALDPDGGDHLAGSTFDPGQLGWKLAEALDRAVEAIAGEGLQAEMDFDAALPADDALVLLRITLADADGASARLVAAMISDAPTDLGMHLVLVKELGKITLEPPGAKAGPVPAPEAAQAPAAAPAAAPGGAPAGYPGIPPGYPATAAAYPGMPAGYLEAPAWPAGYPMSAGYPGMPGGYPMPGYPGVGGAPGGYPSNVRPLTLEELGGGPMGGGGGSMDLLYGVNLEVTVEIGRTRVPIRDVLGWTPGSIVELDKLAGEKVDVLVNGHLIASGEVVVVEENFGVRITDVSARARRLAMGEGAA